MDKNASWKWMILVLLVGFSFWVVSPPKEKIRLGLDLAGGTSLVVKIDEDALRKSVIQDHSDFDQKAIDEEVARVLKDAQDRALIVIRDRIDSLGTKEPQIYKGEDYRIIVQMPGSTEEDRIEAERLIDEVALLEFKLVHKLNSSLESALFAEKKAPVGYRIAKVGSSSVYEAEPGFVKPKDYDYDAYLNNFNVPNAEYEFKLEKNEQEGRTYYKPFFVEKKTRVNGHLLDSAYPDPQLLGNYWIGIKFGSEGAEKFGRLTAAYCRQGSRNPGDRGRLLAILLDGKLYCAPQLNDPIEGGSCVITGQFTADEASHLANILNTGALPAPVKVEDRRFVSPSLGEESIKSGFNAVIYGGIAVIIFMMVYYMVSGVIANIALLLNLVILPLGMILASGFLSVFAKDAGGSGPIQLPVLTLPGIAGILLTIGMAVDANVLIFERIREELKSGKALWPAIASGYDRAFVTIIDANLTTLITAVILFIFGSGPIRGFAVTLTAGILVSMFTALVVTKLLFGVFVSAFKIKTLKMLSVIKETTVDFVAKRKAALIISVTVILVSWSLLGIKAGDDLSSVLGVDFTGGSTVTLTFDNKVAVGELAPVLEKAGFNDANIQYQKEIDSPKEYLVVKVGIEKNKAEDNNAVVKSAGDIVSKTLTENFASAGFEVTQQESVGDQISDELRGRAVMAIIFALLGIIIYITVRFEFGFALGALAALAHDVLVTVGIYCLFGRQLSLPIIAALLTIVGYSVNDTIVVFDRIREDLKIVRGKGFKEICNLSINQTLGRTILTSLTTLLAVVMLLVFGGGAIEDFALALTIGIVVGTYSSIFVATPVVLAWYKDKRPDLSNS